MGGRMAKRVGGPGCPTAVPLTSSQSLNPADHASPRGDPLSGQVTCSRDRKHHVLPTRLSRRSLTALAEPASVDPPFDPHRPARWRLWREVSLTHHRG